MAVSPGFFLFVFYLLGLVFLLVFFLVFVLLDLIQHNWTANILFSRFGFGFIFVSFPSSSSFIFVGFYFGRIFSFLFLRPFPKFVGVITCRHTLRS